MPASGRPQAYQRNRTFELKLELKLTELDELPNEVCELNELLEEKPPQELLAE